jgi:hypothetical protein
MMDVTSAVPSFLSALRSLPLWIIIGLTGAAYAILFVPAFGGIDLTTLRETWGSWIWASAIGFSVLSITGITDRTIEAFRARRKAREAHRILRFVPLDHQRWWHLAKQQDDSFASQISFRCQVTNTVDRPVQIAKVQLLRPRVKANAFMSLQIADSPYHSPKHPVLPLDTTEASVHIMTRTALGSQGKPIRITVAITDQFGEQYRLKNLIIDTNDALAPRLTVAEGAHKIIASLGLLPGARTPATETQSPMPWTYEPGAEYLKTCEAILAEEKRSYAARGRLSGQLGSLNVGLQSEPNYGWTTQGEIPNILWKEGDGTALASVNLDRLLKLRGSLSTEDGDNLERFMLAQLRKDSPYADVAYFVVLSLHRMNRLIDALTTAGLCLAGDKVYAYSNVIGMLSALISHEHSQIPVELYDRVLSSLAPGSEQEFRLGEKINLARVQRLDGGKL